LRRTLQRPVFCSTLFTFLRSPFLCLFLQPHYINRRKSFFSKNEMLKKVQNVEVIDTTGDEYSSTSSLQKSW